MKEKKVDTESQGSSAIDLKRKEVLNLKSKIDHNREMFQAKINKKKFLEMKKNEALAEEKNLILQRGENPNFFIPRRQKLEEYESAKKKFEQEQMNERQEIVKKLLNEKENVEKKKKLYPNLFNINLKPIKEAVRFLPRVGHLVVNLIVQLFFFGSRIRIKKKMNSKGWPRSPNQWAY
jgi:hypothetical protein